jgi:hypothetical protein
MEPVVGQGEENIAGIEILLMVIATGYIQFDEKT